MCFLRDIVHYMRVFFHEGSALSTKKKKKKQLLLCTCVLPFKHQVIRMLVCFFIVGLLEDKFMSHLETNLCSIFSKCAVLYYVYF